MTYKYKIAASDSKLFEIPTFTKTFPGKTLTTNRKTLRY